MPVPVSKNFLLQVRGTHAPDMPIHTPVPASTSKRQKQTRPDRAFEHARARLDLDVMIHMKLVEKVGDLYQIVGSREESSDNEEVPPGAGPSFQGVSNMSNDEVLARMMSRMDMFDTRLNRMESMITDRFQSIKIMHGSLDSRIDTMQGQYQGIADQLRTVIQLLQQHPPPPPES
ncbi:hypothetical protein JCGZ_22164 [Jatropha curcas]|uniref:Uncharacterized protein n=1 Tax=Jatropha curcas TaxID=180498 RepID=A0A067L835_JATCU|nr:hypothetical protein JCGZ_22164 [Jatropha curcas]